ncbi:hypothetical protein ACSFE6_18500 [Pseudomonas baetica]
MRPAAIDPKTAKCIQGEDIQFNSNLLIEDLMKTENNFVDTVTGRLGNQ